MFANQWALYVPPNATPPNEKEIYIAPYIVNGNYPGSKEEHKNFLER